MERNKTKWDYFFEACILLAMAAALYLGFQFLNEISMYN